MPAVPPPPVRALAAFHWRGGTRAALRTGTIGVATVIFAFGSAPDPVYTLTTFVVGIAGRGGAAPATARLLLAAMAFALAALGAHRVTLGASGWPRSLPVTAVDARRAAWWAATLAALPAMLFAVVAPALAIVLGHASLAPAKLVALPVLFAAAGAVSLRVERVSARSLALLALLAAAWGTWRALPVALGTLFAWDRAAAGLAVPVRPPARRVMSPRRRLPPRASGLALAVRWAWRAAGWRAAVESLGAAALPVGFAALVRANNADFSAAESGAVARAGTGLGVALCVATMAAALLARRTPWPWVRTLPWSSAERVAVDAMAVGVPALVVAIAAAVVYGTASLGAAAAGVLVAAPAAAGAMRVGARRQTGAAGETLLVAVPVVVAVALHPAVALGTPVLACALGAWAARRDRRAADAVRWNELRHDVSGDVGWITRA